MVPIPLVTIRCSQKGVDRVSGVVIGGIYRNDLLKPRYRNGMATGARYRSAFSLATLIKRSRMIGLRHCFSGQYRCGRKPLSVHHRGKTVLWWFQYFSSKNRETKSVLL